MKKFFFMLGLWFVAVACIIVGSIIYEHVKTSKYDTTAIPYIKQVIPQISTWDPAVIRGLMTDEALASVPPEKFDRIIGVFSQMGALQSMDEPRFKTVHSEAGVENAKQTIVEYGVEAKYARGDAEIVINLLDTADGYKVQHFNLSSEVLTAGPPSE